MDLQLVEGMRFGGREEDFDERKLTALLASASGSFCFLFFFCFVYFIYLGGEGGGVLDRRDVLDLGVQ